MSYLEVSRLGARMARRNHLYLFAWLCGSIVPVLLQLVAGASEDARTFLMEYYGPISLYMFFTMTYGFATVFVSYYHVGSYRRAGTVDLLRVSQIKPREIVFGVFHRMELILVPPLLAFAVVYIVYARYFAQDSIVSDISWVQGVGFGGMMLLTQAVLSCLPLLGLFRREEPYALLAMLLVLPVNTTPLFAIMVLGHRMPVWLAIVLMFSVLGIVFSGLMWLAVRAVERMWPPQSVA